MSSLAELRKNDFWKRKVHRAVEVRDRNKNGFIERSDFQMVIQRYKDLPAGTVTEEHIKALTESLMVSCDLFGLTDDTKKLTYDEFKEVWLDSKTFVTEKLEKIFHAMFGIIDINQNGFLSLDEWIVHYKSYGIDVAHAPASFEAMDTNHNGKITKDEFIAYHMEFFFSVDDKLKSSILYGPLA